jgi:hypothetical protein
VDNCRNQAISLKSPQGRQISVIAIYRQLQSRKGTALSFLHYGVTLKTVPQPPTEKQNEELEPPASVVPYTFPAASRIKPL